APASPSGERPAMSAPTTPEAAMTDSAFTDCAKAKCLALTFDDGPGPGTPSLLDALIGHGAHATFFTVGAKVATQPDLVRRMREAGNLIGNHTWSHRDLTALPPDRATAQIFRCQNAVLAATGTAPAVMRAPYGAVDERVIGIARDLGLALVRWDVDPRDETTRDPATIAKRVIERAHRGAIVLLHGTNQATVQAMPRVLTELGEQGYTFVTVPELYGWQPLSPGSTYGPAGATRYGE
ncbi:MAG TPA: polysaccharide deacetylase family protein, partial [Micromonosporaceae bacterium]